jgi:hypothetical protein
VPAPTREHVRALVDTYIRAWTGQDPELILTVFTESARYHERVFERPIEGHEGIRDYWVHKVVGSQANIECELLNLYLDGDTAIAEWEARFDDGVDRVRKRMREVAILELRDGLIDSLREYWSSQRIGDLDTAEGLA